MSKNPRGSLARAILPNRFLIGGAATLFIDYIDNKYLISRDLWTMFIYLTLRRQVMSKWNKEYTYADFWEENWKKHPEKSCMVFEGASYTFSDAEKLINRMAHFFISKGVKQGDTVAIMMESRPQIFFTWLALSKIGAISALLNSNQKGVFLLRSIQIVKSKYLVFGNELENSVQTIFSELLADGVVLFCEGGNSNLSENLTPQLDNFSSLPPSKSYRKGLTLDSVWGYVYTSGTTGAPKASVLKHFRLFTTAKIFSGYFSMKKSDRIYTSLPLYHSVAGNVGIGIMIQSGATLVVRRKFSTKHFWKDIIENDCTVFQYSGELCRYLLSCPESEDDKCHKIRLAFGNGLRPDIWEEFTNRFNITQIGEFYASTEGNVILANLGKNQDGVGAVGFVGPISRTFNGARLVLYDPEKGELKRNPAGYCIECKPGQVGELLGKIRGSPFSEFSGYHGNEEGTTKKMIRDVFEKGDQFYRTGDLLKRDERGFFYFVDRIGDNYRWKGENISTSEVSEALSSFKDIQEVNAYGIKLPKMDGHVGMAAIVPKLPCSGSEIPIDMEKLGQHVQSQLPSFAIPVFLRIVTRITITDTLKYRKVDLRKEGINIDVIKDPLFIYNPKTTSYEPLTQTKYKEIMFGRARL